MKKTLSYILCICLIMTLFSGAGLFSASAATYSGTCGDSVTWKYNNSSGTLTISGTGAMSNYSYQTPYGNYVTTAPWWSHYNTMKTVVINSGVTTIGSFAFYGFSKLTSVTISESVKSIYNEAFHNCTGLTSISIPNGVKSIGKSAFFHCARLTSISIPNGLKSIGDSAFEYCTGLQTVIYCGTEKQWNSISIDSKNTLLTSANRSYHLFDTGVIAPTCTEQGYTTYICSRCGDSYVDDYVFALGHTGGTATCHSKALCERCGGCYGEFDPKNHNGETEIRDAKAANCTEKGYTGDTYCLGCGVKIAEGENIPELNHAWSDWKVTADPTCTEKGTETRVCTNDKSHIETREVDPRGHIYTAVITKPTCTLGGYTAYTCSQCGDSYLDDFKPALGHNYNEVVTKPSCTAQGYTTHTCSRCGDIYNDNYTYMPCGGDCGFVINDNTLYIHGSDDIDNYKTQASVPWYNYADSITEIIIDDSITKIGNYAFYCLNNLESIKTKNNNLAFGKYAINSTNADIKVFAENGGALETYCAENGINYIDPTITPELETVLANSVTVKAIDGYEYSMDGANWQRNNTFTGLLPASEYNIYARYAESADIFDALGNPLNVTTLKLTVVAPPAPNYKNHTDNSVTLAPNALYEFSIDGVNWQKSNVFTGLSKNTIYRFYQRVVETETEYASPASAPLIMAIPDKPEILEVGYENIIVKKIDGFEYCLDDFIWQYSNSFDMLIDNTEYYVYQRLKAIDGEKTYQITSDYTAVITDNSIKLITHTPGDINADGYVNNKDLTRLFQYLSGWDVDVNEPALDINGDGKINNKDLTRLFQYLSGWEVNVF